MRAQQFPHSLYYLTESLPPYFGYAKKLVDQLNKKGKKSKSGKPYTAAIITNVVRGMHQDENVKKELERMVEKHGVKKSVEA